MTELAPHGGRSPRVLYVTAAFPFPLHSGYLRHHHLLRHLSQDHHLHLVSLAGPGFEDGHIAGVDHFVDRVDVVRRNANGRNHKLRRLLDPGRLDDTTRRLVDREIRAGAVDVIVLTGKETAPVLDAAADRVPVVADLCDATSSRITQQIARAGSLRRAALGVRRHRMRRIGADPVVLRRPEEGVDAAVGLDRGDEPGEGVDGDVEALGHLHAMQR